ncbi:MAG: hypothetical protein E7128_04450 [Rikenellaceae bacterium]|nr:hypothetical protein [Rikenellaceae bacterium]
MNVKSLLESFCSDKFGANGCIPQDIQQKWVEIIDKHKVELAQCDNSFNEIAELLEHWSFDGIDADVITQTASIIANATDADMAVDKGSAVCFMSVAKKVK